MYGHYSLVIANDHIRRVLNETVPFFVPLSRCSLGNRRDIQISRFQKLDQELTNLKKNARRL